MFVKLGTNSNANWFKFLHLVCKHVKKVFNSLLEIWNSKLSHKFWCCRFDVFYARRILVYVLCVFIYVWVRTWIPTLLWVRHILIWMGCTNFKRWEKDVMLFGFFWWITTCVGVNMVAQNKFLVYSHLYSLSIISSFLHSFTH